LNLLSSPISLASRSVIAIVLLAISFSNIANAEVGYRLPLATQVQSVVKG
jgi:hypothetical protein